MIASSIRVTNHQLKKASINFFTHLISVHFSRIY